MAIRLSAFWYLCYAEATGRQSWSLLPLILMLSPEAYFVPRGHVWTFPSGIVFSVVLLVGSLAMALCVACTIFVGRHSFRGNIQSDEAVEDTADRV